MVKKEFDIHGRIYEFVLSVLKFLRKLPRTQENLVIIGQIAKSVTSVGANDQEADGVSTKREFIHCYTVVRRELKETVYWLRLICDLNPKLSSEGEKLIREGGELTKIVSKIISNARRVKKPI
jgi:four helix bundle protein